MTIWSCPRCGTELEGTMLDANLWCPEEKEEIPNYELED